jgi:hypothetical protein
MINKEVSYYHVTKAYIDEILTEQEFKMILSLGMFT